ncbi:MAG: PAS domain-containing protein [Chloroflexi bacterium]|nr:PAS domain-containing protein [Chloroflexota bacterium]
MKDNHHIPAPVSPPAWPAEIAQAAVQATQHLLLVLDTAGTIQHVNQAALAHLKYRPEQLIGASFVELLDAGSRNKGRALLARALPHEISPVFELNQNTATGEIMLIGYQVTVLPAQGRSNGASARLMLVGNPLNNVIASTERLINLNRRLRALFSIVAATSRSIVLADLLQQALDVAIAELDLLAGVVFLADTPVDLDRTPTVPQLRPGQIKLAAQHGFTSRFVARLSDAQPFAAFWNNKVHANKLAVVSGDADEVGIQPFDLERPAGILLSVLATPLVSENQLVGWLYVVTDRYRAASSDELDLLQTIGNLLGPTVENARLYDALLQTSGRLQAVLDGIDSGVLLVDQEGIVRYANTRLGSLLNADVSRWPGQPRHAVVPKNLVPVKQQSEPFGDQLWEIEDGSSRCLLRRYADLVYDLNEVPLGSIEVYSDVTNIQEMNRLKDEFVAAAAHDLKTPVTAIKGYAQIATRLCRKLDEPRLLQQLAMINARSDELAYLMDALLDMSRLQGGRMWLDLETFTVSDLIANVAKHFEFDLTRRKRNLLTEAPPTPIEVTWDRIRMEGVLINLIGNAIKYSPDGDDIAVSVQPCTVPHDQRNWVEITVTDHGIGIPPEERKQVFERFYRTREAVAEGFKGTGIGLYIAHHIVELHGGRIWADAALHGGRGTTMHVLMPCVSPNVEPSE